VTSGDCVKEARNAWIALTRLLRCQKWGVMQVSGCRPVHARREAREEEEAERDRRRMFQGGPVTGHGQGESYMYLGSADRDAHKSDDTNTPSNQCTRSRPVLLLQCDKQMVQAERVRREGESRPRASDNRRQGKRLRVTAATDRGGGGESQGWKTKHFALMGGPHKPNK
jgi:hypothetical protein